MAKKKHIDDTDYQLNAERESEQLLDLIMPGEEVAPVASATPQADATTPVAAPKDTNDKDIDDDNDEALDKKTPLLRSMQAALGMFLSENELIEVSMEYKESPVYMTGFALVHAYALFLSAIFIFNTIGSRIKSSAAVLAESIRCRRRDRETYVFWGVNAPSVSLARMCAGTVLTRASSSFISSSKI